MTRNRTNRNRRGFSLIELLTVVAILAVLTAIVVGVLVSVRGGQATKVTEETLNKLQVALDQQKKQVADKCHKDRVNKTPDFTALTAFCGGDEDRTEALWLHMQMKREFPQTIAEIDPTGFAVGGVRVYPRKTFAAAFVPAAAAATPEQQSAILVFLNLSEKSAANAGIQADQIAQSDMPVGSGATATSFRVFRDSWGTHIAFVRHAQNAELNLPKYTPPTGAQDPLDPRGKLAGAWPTPGNRALAIAGLNSGLAAPYLTDFNRQNKTMTVVSAGQNKVFDGVANSLGNLSGPSDDVFSFRTKQQGAKAD